VREQIRQVCEKKIVAKIGACKEKGEQRLRSFGTHFFKPIRGARDNLQELRCGGTPEARGQDAEMKKNSKGGGARIVAGIPSSKLGPLQRESRDAALSEGGPWLL